MELIPLTPKTVDRISKHYGVSKSSVLEVLEKDTATNTVRMYTLNTEDCTAGCC